MKCKKCGNKVSEKDNFCNRCGAKVDPADNAATRVLIVTLFSAILYGLLFTASAFAAVFMPILLIPIVAIGAGYAAILFRMFKKGIGYVPNKDNIEKCNRCGSQNIKLYRKGYDYRPGFWGALFGVRGAGYAGGFDANHTCCRCMDCGNDWETDYDYRLIDK
jgi:hypothetical protein